MKKIILNIIFLSLSLSLIGCGSKEEQKVNATNISTTQIKNDVEKSSNKAIKTEEVKENQSSKIEENKLTTVKIISTEASEPIGDRTADNYSDENGEYFAIGSDIVKCSDYENIHVVAELTNNRDTLSKTSSTAWSAKLEDGYELGIFQDGNGVGMMNDGNLGKQIQSGSSVTVEFDILKEKIVKGDKIILTYWDIDFGEDFSSFMSKVMSGASEAEVKKEYPQFFDQSLYYNFEIPLN